jgi:hypothetical protein
LFWFSLPPAGEAVAFHMVFTEMISTSADFTLCSDPYNLMLIGVQVLMGLSYMLHWGCTLTSS